MFLIYYINYMIVINRLTNGIIRTLISICMLLDFREKVQKY